MESHKVTLKKSLKPFWDFVSQKNPVMIVVSNAIGLAYASAIRNMTTDRLGWWSVKLNALEVAMSKQAATPNVTTIAPVVAQRVSSCVSLCVGLVMAED